MMKRDFRKIEPVLKHRKAFANQGRPYAYDLLALP